MRFCQSRVLVITARWFQVVHVVNMSEVGVSYSLSGDLNLSSSVKYFDRFPSFRSSFNIVRLVVCSHWFCHFAKRSFLIFDIQSQVFILRSGGIRRLVATLAACQLFHCLEYYYVLVPRRMRCFCPDCELRLGFDLAMDVGLDKVVR
jgi:hypothetical protein